MPADVAQLPARSCHQCRNARHGATTFCIPFTEVIDNEVVAASDCELYEPED